MMALIFAMRAALQGDAFLNQFSCDPSDLAQELSGKSVAIVGNARSLNIKTFGSAIDACDIVIRMHAAPLPQQTSHGSQTDWLALGMPVAQTLIETRAPSRILWMAKKRKRVRQRFAKSNGFYLHPTQDWDKMAEVLSAPPTTGIMLIDLVARSDAKSINLFGFDFFASLSLSGSRTAAQVPHDFTAEKRFVEALETHDPRVVLHR